MLELLVSCGVSLDGNNEEDNSPLLLACAVGRFEAAKLLVHLGAALVSAKGSALAAARRHTLILQWLLVGLYTDQARLEQRKPESEAGGSTITRVGSWAGPWSMSYPLERGLQRKEEKAPIDWVGRLKQAQEQHERQEREQLTPWRLLKAGSSRAIGNPHTYRAGQVEEARGQSYLHRLEALAA